MPGVGVESAPTRENEPSVVRQRAAQVGERGDRIVEEHYAELRRCEIEGAGLEDVRRRVGVDELDVVGLVRGPLARDRKHRLRNVNPEHPAVRRDALRQLQRRTAAAATDLDDPLAGLRRGVCQQRLAQRGEESFGDGRARTPARPALGIPIGDLVGVRRHGHGPGFASLGREPGRLSW